MFHLLTGGSRRRVRCGVAGFACIFCLVTTLHTNPYDTYWQTRGFCPMSHYQDVIDGRVEQGLLNATEAEVLLDPSHASDGHINIFEACDMSVLSWYIGSVTWAMLLVTGSGGTDEFPSPNSPGDKIIVSLLNCA